MNETEWEDLFEKYADKRDNWSRSDEAYPYIRYYMREAQRIVIEQLLDCEGISIIDNYNAGPRELATEEILERLNGSQ